MKFSKKTGCFYPDDIFYSNMPDDLIEVSQEEFNAAQARKVGATLDVQNGKLLIGDAPSLSDGQLLDHARQNKTASIVTAISQLESEQHRATREVLAAILAGRSAADILHDEAGIRLLRVESDISQWRAKLAAVSKAQTMAELSSIAA
ncbi:hypothetical protein [Chromobacterium violaceum]|uniref:hypothetical protein n=1 Tax=Chromobacterium violaceum TaxID=536 RepID=UPI001C8CB75F|nr:hypothetical protein [Chromobacterium violaceum]MBX9269369.1 hypothetical protein [Chromobacterium violaceum]